MRFLLISLSCLSLYASGCANSADLGVCGDGIDNDGDGWIDLEDPGCAFNDNMAEAPNPDLPQCSDGQDNDGDGHTDYPDDRSCRSKGDNDEFGQELPACSDGVDNDGDGLTDYPDDPGCSLPSEGEEGDDCPDGATCPACSNGVDDDGNGKTDYPADKGCVTAADRSEAQKSATECGAQVTVDALAHDGADLFGVATPNTVSELEGSCGGRGQERGYKMIVPERSAVLLRTNHDETTLDTVVYARTDCGDALTEIACNDDSGGKGSETIVTVDPGTYYVVVDALDSSSGGEFRLTTTAYTPTGDACDPSGANCLPGHVCRKLTEQATFETCELPECKDGLDNDGDTFVDFPFEPGCESPDDNDEADACPDGVACPQCANGVDDDGNMVLDYPNDPSCTSAADPLELQCSGESDTVVLQNVPSIDETSQGATNDFSPSCGFSSSAPDRVHSFVVPGELRTLQVDTIGSSIDTIVSVHPTSCSSADIGCDDDSAPGFGDSLLVLNDVPAGGYVAIVDGWSTNAGAYKLNIRGEVKAGETCIEQQEQNGIFPCELGYACVSGICVGATCNDGMDNDGDGLVDYPEEPGCESPSDNDETDDCPSGGNCPACSNDTDDDGDNTTDYGNDPGCAFAADDDEIDECVPGVPFGVLTDAGVSSTTPSSGSGSNFTPSCHGSTSATEDVYQYSLNRPLSSVTFSTVGSTGDTVTSVRYADCADFGAELACQNTQNGGEDITISNPLAGSYFVFVDGDWVSNISYELNVSGRIPQNETCDPNDTQFTCDSGLTCQSNVCEPTACNDGTDNDGDTFIDFPNDPGCLSIDDTDESDDCPSGPNCPACGNGQDDDGDSFTDFGPMGDPGCESAADSSEIDDCIAGVPVEFLPDTGVTGTTPQSGTGGNNFSPTCHSSTLSSERVYVYPVDTMLDSITFTTEGSTGDTVTYVRYDMCDDIGAEIDCANTQNGGEAITIPNPQLGDYFVFVDGDFTSGIDYQLNVRGTLMQGATCTPGNQQWTCMAGTSCQNNTCEPTACNDGADGDGDGFADYPDDPGCTDISDNDETDDCPSGPNCPDCANGQDDDGDGLIDFGTNGDPGCSSAADTIEIDECIPGVQVLALPDAGVMSTTPASGSNFSPSCNGSTSATEDVYGYMLNRNLTELRFSTVGSAGDTVLSARYDTCGDTNAEVACLNTNAAGEEIRIDAPPQGNYFVFVDGDFVSGIDYVLNVSGDLANGETCDPSDTQWTCSLGTSCVNNVCTGTACNDGMDNDGDGLIDYPDEPGCYSILDTDEGDMCPAGNDCPDCSNTNDDDGDGNTDVGSDPGCANASDLSEVTCADMDPVIDLRLGEDIGTTGTASNDFTPSCSANSSAPDRVFSFVAPGTIASIDITTDGSSFDTVLYLKSADCTAAEIDCDDDGGAGLQSKITQTNLPAGEYFIFVDGYSSNSGNYVLSIDGELASGAACFPHQTYLTCPTGETCTASGGGHVCQ